MIIAVDESGWETMPSDILFGAESILVISHDREVVVVAKDRGDRFTLRKFPLAEMGSEISKALEMRRITW